MRKQDHSKSYLANAEKTLYKILYPILIKVLIINGIGGYKNDKRIISPKLLTNILFCMLLQKYIVIVIDDDSISYVYHMVPCL